MLAFLEGPDLIIVAVIVLVIFGGSKIPQLARSLGEAQREFKKGVSGDAPSEAKATEAKGTATDTTTSPTPPAPAPPEPRPGPVAEQSEPPAHDGSDRLT
jgi:sec-independent protein translocase protein TatA